MFDFILSWNIWEKWLYQTLWGEETNHSSNSLQTHKIQHTNINKSPTPKFIVIYKLSIIKILKFFINKTKWETKMGSSGSLDQKMVIRGSWFCQPCHSGHRFVIIVSPNLGERESPRSQSCHRWVAIACSVSMSWQGCSAKEFVVTLVRHKFFYASEGIIYRSIWKYFSS